MMYKMPWKGLIEREHYPNISQKNLHWVFLISDEEKEGGRNNLGFVTCWWDTSPEDGEPVKF